MPLDASSWIEPRGGAATDELLSADASWLRMEDEDALGRLRRRIGLGICLPTTRAPAAPSRTGATRIFDAAPEMALVEAERRLRRGRDFVDVLAVLDCVLVSSGKLATAC